MVRRQGICGSIGVTFARRRSINRERERERKKKSKHFSMQSPPPSMYLRFFLFVLKAEVKWAFLELFSATEVRRKPLPSKPCLQIQETCINSSTSRPGAEYYALVLDWSDNFPPPSPFSPHSRGKRNIPRTLIFSALTDVNKLMCFFYEW